MNVNALIHAAAAIGTMVEAGLMTKRMDMTQFRVFSSGGVRQVFVMDFELRDWVYCTTLAFDR